MSVSVCAHSMPGFFCFREEDCPKVCDQQSQINGLQLSEAVTGGHPEDWRSMTGDNFLSA